MSSRRQGLRRAALPARSARGTLGRVTDDWEQPVGRPRWQAALLAAGLGVLALVAFVGRGGGQDSPPAEPPEDDGELVIELDVDPQDPATAALPGSGPWQISAPRPVGGWSEPQALPLASRERPHTRWTGSKVVVWGGRDADGWRADGILADPGDAAWPGAPAWEQLPDAPLTDGPDAVVVADDGRFTVLNGRPVDGGSRHALFDGQRWRPLPELPAGDWRLRTATPSPQGVALAGTVGAAQRIARFDGEDWRLEPGPDLHGVRALTSTAHGFVAVGPLRTEPRALGATLQTGSGWSPPEPLPGLGDWTLRLAGDDTAVVALAAAHDRAGSHFSATWSAADGWRLLPAPPAELARSAPHLLQADESMLAWPGRGTATAGLLDRDGQGWRELAPAPWPAQEADAVWTGTELVSVGTAEGLAVASWQRVPAEAPDLPAGSTPRSPSAWSVLEVGDARRAVALAVAAEDLLIWGQGGTSDGVRFADASGLATPLVGAPFPAGATPAAAAVDDGVLLIGQDLNAGRYDPSTGDWTALGRPDLAAGGRVALASDGAGGALLLADGQAARYDPTNEAITPQDDPPVAPETPRMTTVDRDEVFVAGDDGVALRWRAGAWSLLPPHPLPAPTSVTTIDGQPVVAGPDGVGVLDGSGWTRYTPEWASAARVEVAALDDSTLFVWGGALVGDAQGGRAGAALLDVGTATWTVTADPPSGVSPAGWQRLGDGLVGWSPDGRLVRYTPPD